MFTDLRYEDEQRPLVSGRSEPMQLPTFIPRGIADREGAHAYVRTATAVLAVDLASGALVWRSAGLAKPLVLIEGLLVVARGAAPHGLQLASLDPSTGTERLASAVVALPPWATLSLDDGPSFTLRAAADGPEAVVRWEAHARYRGGAPPPPDLAGGARRDAGGTVRYDPHSGSVREDGGDPPEAPAPDPAPPGVLEARRVGGRRLDLTVETAAPGRVRVVLRAFDVVSGSESWTLALEDAPARARPLRP